MKTFSVIEVKTSLGVKFINASDIVYVKTRKKHSIVTTLKIASFEAFHPINWFENHLPSNKFYRCHNSYIVNCRLVNCVNYSNQRIYLNGFGALPFSRRRKSELLLRLKASVELDTSILNNLNQFAKALSQPELTLS